MKTFLKVFFIVVLAIIIRCAISSVVEYWALSSYDIDYTENDQRRYYNEHIYEDENGIVFDTPSELS